MHSIYIAHVQFIYVPGDKLLEFSIWVPVYTQQDYWRAKLESAYSLIVYYCKNTVCFTKFQSYIQRTFNLVVSVFVTAIFAACSSGKQSKNFIIESLSITIVSITDFTVQSIYFFHFISGNSYSTHSFVRGDNSINRRY